jgi:hypothetical protein
VQKTATYLLAHAVRGETDVNFGHPLPSGLSLYSLLKEVASDEATELAAAFQPSNSTISGTSGGVIASGNGTVVYALINKRRLGDIDTDSEHNASSDSARSDSEDPQLLSSVLLTSADHSLTQRILGAKKGPAPPAPGAQTEGSVNTLVRLLQKIPQTDILALQRAVMAAAPSYRYYEFNSSLGKDAPPLTATHTYPSGGAIGQLERLLSARKSSGVVNVTRQCEVRRTE